jgi:CDP-diacylglycerol--glycerol-3-phosphate 3-phosphatidyltransferase
MEANIITLARIILTFITVAFFQIPSPYTRLAGTLLVILVISLDSLDGYVARKLKVASDFGALFDITGDRIVENVYWIYFAVIGMISFWVPLIVISRSFLVDSVRAVAFRKGKTAFGEKTMMKSSFTRFLVASPFSRSLYGGLKVVTFTLLGFLLFLRTAFPSWGVREFLLNILETVATFLLWLTVVVCLLRGLPVLWDGKEILFEKEYPRRINIG